MALSDEQILDIAEERQLYNRALPAIRFARAIEVEVRKDDTALIRQMLEALTACRANGAIEGFVFDMATGAIKAARARLEQAKASEAKADS